MTQMPPWGIEKARDRTCGGLFSQGWEPLRGRREGYFS
jgi:hypothetical protein